MHGRLLAAESRLVTLAAAHHQRRWAASLHPDGRVVGRRAKECLVGELLWPICVVCVGIAAAACSWICSPKAGLLLLARMLSLAARFPAAKPKRPKLHFTASE